MASWLGLGVTLTAKGIANPRVGLALLRVGWRFRSREWYRRFPFLPLPDRHYLKWRMYTAYGDEDSIPPADDIVRYARWGGARLVIEPLMKAQAYGLGFDLVGITDLGPAETAERLDDWLAHGYAGEMAYMPRTAEKRRDTRSPFDGVTRAIVVAMSYGGREPSGPVARYARGDDYHDVMLERLQRLHAWIEQTLERRVRGKAYVDTGPLLERDLARRAGLGWFGKNTMLIHPRAGSFFFLGTLLLDLDLALDEPFTTDHCGSCRRCIDACPTGAIVEPRVLDANRCISYLTIELKGDIPSEMHAPIGELLYGCDVCQEVCPWNEKFALPLREAAFRPRAAVAGKDARTLARDILAMTDEDFRMAFKGSPMKRAKLRGLKRNAAVVMGNAGAAEDPR